MLIPEKTWFDSNPKLNCLPKVVAKHYPEFYNHIQTSYPNVKKFSEGLWLFYNGKPQVCKYCGKHLTKFHNWTDGYGEYCSVNCARKGTRDKAEQTKKSKYGNNGVSEKTIKKRKQTCLKRYGVENATQLKRIQEKRKQTCFKRYGVEHATKTREVLAKIHSTMMSKYGVEHALQHPEFLEKSKQTCKTHYGVEYPGQNAKIMTKIKQTQKRLYGGMGLGSEATRQKIHNTVLSKYGRDWGFNYEKVRQTNLQKYGDENPLIARCSRGEIKFQGYSNISQQFCRELDCFFEGFETQYATKGGEHRIDTANGPYYVDYFVPELNIAFEFNGDAWHGNPSIYNSDDQCFPKDKSITAGMLWARDLRKYQSVEETGILIFVMWESEYRNCKDLNKWISEKLAAVFD